MKTTKKKDDTSLKDFLDALDEIQKTKGIDKEEIIQAVEAAIVSAYKKDYKGSQSARAEIDRQTGELELFAQKEVVENAENEAAEISLSDAKKISLAYVLGDVVEFKVNPADFGRVAAQNAKQYIFQRLKEAERNVIYEMYAEKKNELVTGIVQRIEKNDIYVNIGKTDALMNLANQIPNEHYFNAMRMKVYITDVVKTNKGAQIYVSRSHPGLIRRLFEFEIPEIYDGTVEIMSIAREAGSRTKIAVRTKDASVDAVGACVGHKGVRIQNILNEIGSERIDVIEYSDNPVEFISSAINPATVDGVIIDEDNKMSLVVVDDSQLSLAIGKDGQNVRLAAKLTGWKIDIKNHAQYQTLLSEYNAQGDGRPDQEDSSFDEISDENTEEVSAEITVDTNKEFPEE